MKGLASRIWTIDSGTTEPQRPRGAEMAEPDRPAALCDLEKSQPLPTSTLQEGPLC